MKEISNIKGCKLIQQNKLGKGTINNRHRQICYSLSQAGASLPACCSLLHMGQHLAKLTWIWNLKLYGDFIILFSCESLRMIQNQTRWPCSYCGISATGQSYFSSQHYLLQQLDFPKCLKCSKRHFIERVFFLQLPLAFSGKSNVSQNSESQHEHSQAREHNIHHKWVGRGSLLELYIVVCFFI